MQKESFAASWKVNRYQLLLQKAGQHWTYTEMMIIFAGSLLLLIYIYFLYPIVLSMIKQDTGSKINNRKVGLPFVSVLVAAYNEEKHIATKIENILNQDYPADCYELVIISDCSTDRTVEIARSYKDPRIIVIENTNRSGKNTSLNLVEPRANGEILVFSDANAIFCKDALYQLSKSFADPSVGLVCGHLKYLKSKNGNVEQGEGLYFRYEAWIKRLQSRLGAVAVVTGAIYAIRRNLFEPLEPDVANDFAHPVQVGAKGYKVIFEPCAIAFEKATSSVVEEFRRRVRIVTRGFTAFGKYWKKYNMLRGLRGFCFISHKLLRWFAPFYLAGFFISSALLPWKFFQIVFVLQIIFYSFAILGFFTKKHGKFFAVPFYFSMINLAAFWGFVNFLRGKRQSIWNIAGTTR